MSTTLNTNETQPVAYYEAEEAARLRKDYAALLDSVETTLERMRALPRVVTSEEDLEKYGVEVSAARDLEKRLIAIHDVEKAPHLGRGKAADNVFYSASEKLIADQKKKGAKPGAVDICQARVNDYLQEQLRIARAKRAAEAAEAERKLREAAAALAAEQAAAAEAAAKAARARKVENAAAHQAEAQAHAEAAKAAALNLIRADEAAADALIETRAKAADLVQVRLESGGMASMRDVPHVEILDVAKLDKDVLWPFLKEEHILMALKAWAKTKSHKTPMAGAGIEMRDRGGIR